MSPTFNPLFFQIFRIFLFFLNRFYFLSCPNQRPGTRSKQTPTEKNKYAPATIHQIGDQKKPKKRKTIGKPNFLRKIS